jgi:hypothetical protein
MATVIDSLVVLLGLDASNYKKGRETAEKETKETARVTKSSADDITKSLVEVGKTVAGLFLGFETVTGFAKFLGGLNASEAALGRTAQRLDMGVHELNRWGQAAALLGGSAEGTQAAFEVLTAGVNRFLSGQGSSPILDLMRQAGVATVTAAGKLRNQGEVFEEFARKTAHWTDSMRAQRLKDAGINQDEIAYLLRSNAERQDALRIAESHNNVTDESVKKAQELQEYWRDIGQRIEAAGQIILEAITPALESVLSVFSDINVQGDEFQTGLKLIGSAAVVIKNLFVGMGDAIGGAAAAIGAALHGDFKGAAAILKDQSARSTERNEKEAPDLLDLWETKDNTAAKQANIVARSGENAGGYQPPPGSKAARFNNPGNILDRQGNERRYASPAEGQAALERDLAIKMRRGLRTVDAIITAYEGGDTVHNNIPAYIADVRKRLGKNELTPDDIKSLAQAIAIHESGPTPGIAGKVSGASTGGNCCTTVTIGTIQVNAPNADPRAVADHIAGAIQRKQDVSQAMQGQS